MNQNYGCNRERHRSHYREYGRILKGVVIGAIAWMSLARSTFSQPAFSQTVLAQTAQIECALFSEPQRFNTQQTSASQSDAQSAEVIVIGHQPNRPYRVVLIDGSEATLTRIRTCVLDAYLT